MTELDFPQLELFELDETKTGVTELFPAVWGALEKVTAADVAGRHQGLDKLIELDAPRLSPLVAYVLATRLTDPEVGFRARIIRNLGEIISKTGNDSPSFSIRMHLKGYSEVVQQGTIMAILEVAEAEPSVKPHIATLFNLWPHSGAILSDITINRRVEVPLRRQAIDFIGRVGFVEAIPALERLVERLASRANGQKRMPFAPPSVPDEASLLTSVQATLASLKEI